MTKKANFLTEITFLDILNLFVINTSCFSVIVLFRTKSKINCMRAKQPREVKKKKFYFERSSKSVLKLKTYSRKEMKYFALQIYEMYVKSEKF